MTMSIVERLLRRANVFDDECRLTDCELVLEAKTEIEHLQAALKESEDDAERQHTEAMHWARLACDDIGKNPPVFWKDEADRLQSELNTALERVKVLEEAFSGPVDTPEVISPLSWLRSMIEACKEQGPSADGDSCDAEAFFEMISEVETFEKNARAVLQSSGGK
jgi:hypothetical protein